jgi:thymidylate kinase
LKNNAFKVFHEFEQKDLKYCFIRSLNDFDNAFLVDNSDIDLIVEKIKFVEYKNILNNNSFFNLFKHKSFYYVNQNISFDLYNGYYERFIQLDINKALNNRVKKDFFMLSDIDLFKVLLFHPMDLCGVRGVRYYSKERSEWIKNNLNILTENKEEFETYFGKKFIFKIINYIQNNEFDKIKQDNLKFKILMYLHKPSYLKYFFQRLKKKIIKPEYQKSKLIIFMGVDGSGKTTAAQNSINFMKRYYGNNASKIEYFYLGSQGGYMLPLVQIAQMKDKLKSLFKEEKIQKVDRAKSKNTVSSNHGKLKEMLFIFEYIARYIKLQYLLKIKNKIVVSDRYLYDYFRTDNTDPKMVKFFSKIFPKPDFIFMMEGDIQKFYDRKQEYSPKILKEHQDDLINGLTKEGLEFYSINANQDEEEVLKSILRKLGD